MREMHTRHTCNISPKFSFLHDHPLRHKLKTDSKKKTIFSRKSIISDNPMEESTTNKRELSEPNLETLSADALRKMVILYQKEYSEYRDKVSELKRAVHQCEKGTLRVTKLSDKDSEEYKAIQESKSYLSCLISTPQVTVTMEEEIIRYWLLSNDRLKSHFEPLKN
jgi:hypothetical protein